MHKQALKRGRPIVMLFITLTALMIASSPMSVPAFADWQHNQKVNALSYKQQYGFWEVLNIPEEFKLNAIHGAVLPTGKVLLVAGTGNNRDNFNKYSNEGNIQVLKTVLFDPETNELKTIDTPSDLFCSGHTMLQGGNLLIAGGTSGYELLEADVTKPAGAMMIQNEDPDMSPRNFPKGTKFVSPSGKTYLSTEEVTIQPAHKMDHGNGNVMIHHSSTKVFVEAAGDDSSYITDSNEQYRIEGLEGNDTRNVYGQGGPMTLDKQDFRGDDKTYEFDPIEEKYIRVGDLKESRWYASLPVLTNGDVLAVSGLDNTGIITETTERYDTKSRTWEWGPNQEFPTYPALFRTKDPNVLFFSGSSAGYGPADKGREPGFWNVEQDTFKPVSGLRDTNILETSASVMLPPKKGSNDGSQSWKIMVSGGGGIGESVLVTDRTDIIDLDQPEPAYTPGPNLPTSLRYINMSVTPWDEVFASGGTKDYRSKGNSYSYNSLMMDLSSGSLKPMAEEIVGRGYHSGSLLLKDGRILVFGNDPLFSDKDNFQVGKFEQRIEIFTPPQYFRNQHPTINGDFSPQITRGQRLSFTSPDADQLKTARLIPPSSSTHVTNIEQRSVGAVLTKENNNLTIDIPSDENLLPNGWYMLFLVNGDDMPSVAKMVQIVR